MCVALTKSHDNVKYEKDHPPSTVATPPFHFNDTTQRFMCTMYLILHMFTHIMTM